MPGKNLVLKLKPKMLLANEILVFFNCQCFINGLTFGFHFSMQIEMNEKKGFINGFLKKKKHLGGKLQILIILDPL